MEQHLKEAHSVDANRHDIRRWTQKFILHQCRMCQAKIYCDTKLIRKHVENSHGVTMESYSIMNPVAPAAMDVQLAQNCYPESEETSPRFETPTSRATSTVASPWPCASSEEELGTEWDWCTHMTGNRCRYVTLLIGKQMGKNHAAIVVPQVRMPLVSAPGEFLAVSFGSLYD